MTTPVATPVPPALTPEEWERLAVWRKHHMIDGTTSCGPLNIRWNAGGGTPGRHFQELDSGERHAFAALCLHDHPFGFTAEDVEIIEGLLVVLGRSTDPRDLQFYGPYLTSLRNRIAALLPPDR